MLQPAQADRLHQRADAHWLPLALGHLQHHRAGLHVNHIGKTAAKHPDQHLGFRKKLGLLVHGQAGADRDIKAILTQQRNHLRLIGTGAIGPITAGHINPAPGLAGPGADAGRDPVAHQRQLAFRHHPVAQRRRKQQMPKTKARHGARRQDKHLRARNADRVRQSLFKPLAHGTDHHGQFPQLRPFVVDPQPRHNIEHEMVVTHRHHTTEQNMGLLDKEIWRIQRRSP